MSKELIVSTGKHETRVAILEDDQLVEIFHEREKEYSLAGSIHKGRVTRVLPGMQSAFVDIGLERDAFLYVSDFFEDNDEYDAVVSTVEEKVLKLESRGKIEQAVVAEPAPAAAEAPASEVAMAAPAAPAVTEVRPHRQGDRNPERDGERGGRGRRGRRRRGGRGGMGGIPESKFFSPRNESEAAAGGEAESERESPAESAPAAFHDDFMVLPGESLAKYSEADESPDSAEDTRPESRFEVVDEVVFEAAPEPEARAQVAVEPAIPDEHPLAGIGLASPAWLETPTPVAPTEPATAHTVASAPVASPVEPAAEVAVEEREPPFLESESSVAGEPENGISEFDRVESELGESEFADADLTENDLAESEPAEGTQAVEAEEGPEPARIPTSLTATLREQGHRYPHRVSRRMRRKMRGGQQEERQPGDAPQQAEADETRTVQAREERPEGATDRPERTERTDRGERTERGERSERAERSDRGERSERRDRDRPRGERGERTERPERERPPLPSIADLLKEGQEIIVQIAKEPLGQKGARITSHIALPGRFVVYMPTVDHAGVSRKIPSDEERQRLKKIVQTHRQGIPGGFICRTAAENKSEEELKSDMQFLYNLWLDMRAKAEKKPAPVLLHHDLDLVQRILRDQLTSSFKNIWVDGEELYESVLRFAQRFQPALVARVKLYTRNNPIFDEFGITNELEKALRPKVWLKSGGYIVINQTEALVAIDINTGKYVGKSNRLEDTIVKVNTDAIKEIVRQIRLRDLGGIIVVDFIDMDERRNRQKVMQSLEETMRADRAPYKILQFNDFGLVAITRKRVKQSLERTLCAPCPYCEGAGYVKSAQTVIGEILQEAQRMRKALENEHTNVVLRVNPEVGRVLKSNHNQFLQEIEEILGKSVLVKSDPLLHQTKFDLA
jgi:ribonuclease G